MRIDTFGKLLTWIDALYATHDDMRSQTGGIISLGKGTITNKSIKQKMNTKSSTESEVVGVSDILPYNIWIVNFLKSQGYEITEKILFQDNTSAIKSEKNGIQSCSSKSRHINIRYFFITDKYKKVDIDIRYCATNEMLADFFTKPLQGTFFRRMRNVIMGTAEIETLYDLIPKIKEPVG